MTRESIALALVLSIGAAGIGLLAQQAPVVAPVPPLLQNYRPVTAERLLKPDDSDVLMVRRTYDGWGFSPLKAINTSNVARLQPVWSFATGQTSGHEATPLVNNGVMFVATPGNQVLAIDAKSGTLLWRYLNTPPPDVIQLHRTSRGVALYGDKVFFARAEAVLVALDARTGKEVWSATVEDNRNGYYISMAPLVADGKVIVGTSGGELGVRGFIAAYDVETGARLWKVFTVPEPGQPGSETWPTGDQWKTGGGSIWVTANYDPVTKLAFFGTGNGGPWMGDQRPGDNLYTSSTVAIDVTTGTIRGHHQYDPNESWDWDEVSPPILVDFQRNGRTVKGLIDIARDGYMWFLERTDGPIRFVDAQPYVKQNVFRSVDPKTGRPDVDPDRKPGTGKRAEFCPSFWGGKNWPPIAFNPETRLIYIPANENLCSAIVGREITYSPGTSFVGATSTLILADEADHIGEVQAWNVDTGKRVWTHKYRNSPTWGPMLTTAGGLVFSGGTNDRKFHAFDAKSGKLLWEFPTSSGIIGQPSTFSVDGIQYVAVQSGWGVDSRSMQGRLNGLRPGEFPEVPEGGTVWVFAVR
ncbi:MAG TPA: PQQ-dependent dehydrogenase, methanol/ethanol family [Vicinamibacterales bacterium]|nr:PQQ-dependent dehydrogenase, methanol/ethanol family [Vicinamibacterales bacterium]